jgi:hypothetical protein
MAREPLTGMMACFACGTVTRPAKYIPAGPVCPACDAKRIDALVAQRCALLVEALEEIDREGWWRLGKWASNRARAALAAHRAQEKAGGAEADQ